MYPGACFMGPSDGTKMQAEVWKKSLIEKNHEVDLISPWQGYDWKSYDIVHVFGFGPWVYDVIHWGSRLNPNFVFSPIIDTNTPIWAYKIATHLGCKKLRTFSQNYMLRLLKNDVKMFYVRTEYESNYLIKGYGIEQSRITKVPLSYRMDLRDSLVSKEPFCLFVGTMTQERKNVNRLIDAAKKFKFNLVLVGNTGSTESLSNLKNKIGSNSNVIIKGFVTDAELSSLYNRAKVFALPSINEGVGLVALEAAVCGCNIVLTKLGGPKEYYPNELVRLVDPYNVDEIGQAIVDSMNDNSKQPFLRDKIVKNYNENMCIDLLINSYERVLRL